MTDVAEVAVEQSPGPGIWCCSLELAGGGAVVSGAPRVSGQRRARILVRVHGDPIGYIAVPLGSDEVQLDVGDLVRRSWSDFTTAITTHLETEGMSTVRGDRPPAALSTCPNRLLEGPLVSVVVCTRNRAAMLTACLNALSRLSYGRLEFIIVDNAPTDDSTRQVVESLAGNDPRFRYVVEPQPGLSRARNRGLREATGDRVAFTDDDVVVDAAWVSGLVRGFGRRGDVGCVTGLACTASVTNAPEAYFDARNASWSTRFTPEVFDLSARQRRERGPMYPYSPGVFGTGACCAVDRRLALDLGGFDEALGAGARTRGGEDLDMFLRVVRAGRALAYEPAAIVWHQHRGDDAGLLRQMFGYGSGLSAYMTKLVVQSTTRGDVLRRIPRGAALMTRIGGDTSERLDQGVGAPKGALLREFAGMAAGPALYWQAVRATGRDGRGRARDVTLHSKSAKSGS